MIIGQSKTAVVQSRHCFDKAEPQSDARGRKTRLAPVKTLGHARFLGIRYPRPVVGDNDLDLPVAARCDAQADFAAGWQVLDRIVDEVAHRLGQR